MHPLSKISHLSRDPHAALPYATGVSLHSHTSNSIETLNFVQAMCSGFPFANRILRLYDKRNQRAGNQPLDLDTAHWRPPLVPRMAFDLEASQILNLGLHPLVSITDHDDIQAPLHLRTLPSARSIPASVEWTVPFGRTAFHLGIHNLPSAEAPHWMTRFAAFTAAPSAPALATLLRQLSDIPQVLVILNHPVWDLYTIGAAAHMAELDRFLTGHNHLLHAFELNGLRHATENRRVERLAGHWRQLLISGGDRHGLEPNACLNLTDALTFTAFVTEIRVHRHSHILYMPQYDRPWEHRILESTLDAITDHPHFSPGWQRWDERAFHRDNAGTMRPLAELWTNGRPPLPFRLVLPCARLLRRRRLGSLAAAGFALLSTTPTETPSPQDLR